MCFKGILQFRWKETPPYSSRYITILHPPLICTTDGPLSDDQWTSCGSLLNLLEIFGRYNVSQREKLINVYTSRMRNNKEDKVPCYFTPRYTCLTLQRPELLQKGKKCKMRAINTYLDGISEEFSFYIAE